MLCLLAFCDINTHALHVKHQLKIAWMRKMQRIYISPFEFTHFSLFLLLLRSIQFVCSFPLLKSIFYLFVLFLFTTFVCIPIESFHTPNTLHWHCIFGWAIDQLRSFYISSSLCLPAWPLCFEFQFDRCIRHANTHSPEICVYPKNEIQTNWQFFFLLLFILWTGHFRTRFWLKIATHIFDSL